MCIRIDFWREDMKKNSGQARLHKSSKYFILLLIGIVIIVIVAIYIKSISIVGTVVLDYSNDTNEVRVVTEKCGLGDYEIITLSYGATSLWKEGKYLEEGDKIWALCDSFIDLSEPPILYAKSVQKIGVVTGSKYEKMKEKDVYCIELPDKVINQEKIQNELNALYTQVEAEMLLKREKSADELEKYVSYYGGSYIAADKLIVCTTEADRKLNVADDRIVYKVVEYSYNDLLAIQNDLTKKYEKLYEKYKNSADEIRLLDSISGFGIDEETNSVVVDIFILTEERKKEFVKLFGNVRGVEFREP